MKKNILNQKQLEDFRIYIKNTFDILLKKNKISPQNLANYFLLNISDIFLIIKGFKIPSYSIRLIISKKLNTKSSKLWRIKHIKQINFIIKNKKEV